MHSQKKFDEILKKKLDSKEFPLDEANWEKAAAMIDASRKGKNRAGLYIFSSLIVLICGVAGFYTLNTISNPEQTTQNQGVAQINAETLSKSIIPDQINNAEEVNAGTTEPITVSNQELKTESQNKIKTNANTKHENGIVAAENSSKQNAATSGKALTQKTSANTNDNITSNGNASIEMRKTGKKSGIENSAAEKQINETDANKTAEENKTPEFAAAEKTNTGSDLKPVTTATENTIVKNENPAIITASAVAAIASVDSAVKEAEKIKKIDTASAVAEAAKPIIEPKLYKNFISFEAGADYLLGWKNPNSTDANGFNPVAGINYTHFFNKKIGFTVGAQYNTISNLNYSSHTASVTSYAFGQENDITIITPVKLHYAVVPFKFNFAVNPNNIIGIGCNVGYLMTVDNKVETYNERLNYTSEHSVSKTKGYVSGIKNFDTQLSLFYRKTIYKELSVNAEVLYGLSDVKDNSFFNSNTYERNAGFKLTLVLNAFKR